VTPVWTKVGPQAEQRAVRSLRAGLDSGRWAARNGGFADLDAADLGHVRRQCRFVARTDRGEYGTACWAQAGRLPVGALLRGLKDEAQVTPTFRFWRGAAVTHHVIRTGNTVSGTTA